MRAQRYTEPNSFEYEREERYIKRRVRKNSVAAGIFFMIALFLFVVLIEGACMYWKADFSTTEDGGISQVAFILPLARTEATYNDLAKYISTALALMACNFFACLAFRRGEEKRVKGFWLFLYLFGTLAVLAAYFFWNVSNVCDGDIQLWLSDMAQLTDHAKYWYAAAVLSLIGLVAFICAHNSGLFAGKTDRIKRKENGKLHGGVCLMYLLTCIFSYFVVIVFCVYLIIRKIVKSITRDDDDYDMASETFQYSEMQPQKTTVNPSRTGNRRIGGR